MIYWPHVLDSVYANSIAIVTAAYITAMGAIAAAWIKRKP